MTDNKENNVGVVAAKATAAEQLPLVFAHKPATGRDDLLVAAPVDAAVGLLDAWPHWPSPVVVLAGPPGCGKTHLASIWKQISGAADIHPTVGSGAEQVAAGRPVLFEDADRREFDETTLFHVINSVRQHGMTMLMTSRSWPSSWPVSLPDLRSRLKAVTVVEIGEPDEALLSQIIVKLFSDRQLYMDDKLVAYIVNRMERSLDAACILVDKLDSLALSRGTRITRALVAEVLNGFSSADSDD